MAKTKKTAKKKTTEKKGVAREIGAKIGAEIDKELAKEGKCRDFKWKKSGGGSGSCGAVYGLGLIGALVYFIQTATGFWDGVLGVLKALVWPAFLIYKALAALGL